METDKKATALYISHILVKEVKLFKKIQYSPIIECERFTFKPDITQTKNVNI